MVDFTIATSTPRPVSPVRARASLEITPDGLEGRRIGVVKGTAHEAYRRNSSGSVRSSRSKRPSAPATR
jgi:hypothetical protein